MMRTLTYYVAMSLDGFIAHEDGSYDGFVWDDEFVADFMESLNQFDTVLMGRKTYEVGLKEGKTSPYPTMRQIVFSRTMTSRPDEAIELVSDNMVETVRNLKQEDGQPIWLCGGGMIAATLFKAGLLDEIIIKVNPVLFGSGIRLFSEAIPQTALRLTHRKIYRCGIATLHYEPVV